MSWIDLEELDQPLLQKVLKLVHMYTGITMGIGKKTLIQGRLRPRIRKLGLSSYGQYIEYLNSHKDEVQEFVNLVTTNETSFFRTQRVWDFFTKEFLPLWIATNPDKTLKIWSGAASSGEEIYTIGICCEEYRQKNPGFNYQIMGTDISSEVLAIAEVGEYSGRSIEAFKANNRQLFDKYMESTEGVFRVRSDIRSKIRFGIHNLFQIPVDPKKYDIIFLRNVLIYFEPKDQEKVLSNISKGLVPDGVLIIGESESLSSLCTPFKYKLPLVYEKAEECLG
ncbi:MAG: protein-glutamate O-methyltransferase CheR [Bacteriovorax sp.]|nr:protein-glutamate O-methyltransferase CheR [Bacteriovorax sp.]